LTTHSRLLCEWLSSIRINTICTKEPTLNSPVANVIRSMLRDSNPRIDLIALLFAADRVWHLHVDPTMPGGGIVGALERGYTIVTDRYKYSSLAYQGAYLGIEWVDIINNKAIESDILIYIDVPVEVALKRIKARMSGREFYEDHDKLYRVKEAFDRVLSIAEERGVTVIRVSGVDDAGREYSIVEMQNHIRSRLIGVLGF